MKATAIISTTLSATAIALIASPAFADFEIDFSQDASLHLERVLGTDGYFLPTGAYDGEKVPGLRTEGYVVQQVWRTSGTDTATLGLLTPLRQQIAVGHIVKRRHGSDVPDGGYDGSGFHLWAL